MKKLGEYILYFFIISIAFVFPIAFLLNSLRVGEKEYIIICTSIICSTIITSAIWIRSHLK